jgi:AraC-like DNA-binding protein
LDGDGAGGQTQQRMRTPGKAVKPEASDTSLHRAATVEVHQVAVERVISHIKLHLEKPFDLDQIAQLAAISKFHFVRVFEEITGTTPHHFLACLRVQRAKELLLNSKSPITEICFEVGYTSLGSFSATFSALVGVSPQQFRQLPKRLTPTQFAKAVWHFLASNRKIAGRVLEGEVEGSGKARGFTFVGAFTTGVPQGMPFSGTVLLAPGRFRIQRPDEPEFHLLGAFIPLSADLSTIVTTLPVGMVGSLRVQNTAAGAPSKPRLRLRPLRLTDPPIVLALPALAPWREMFTD